MGEATTADAFAQRLFDAGLGMIDMLTIYIGDRLGFYSALAEATGLTASELADRTATHPRYAREWLEQQAVTGVLAVDDVGVPDEARRYSLPAAHAQVLTQTDDLLAMSWLARVLVIGTQTLPQILDAFRTGGGVSWSGLGSDAIEGQGDQNRPVFTHLLAQEWIPQIPDVHQKLRAGHARVADVCCGVGWAAIGIARAFELARVDGFDLDEMSIDAAKRNAAALGLSDRVSFEVRDAADPAHAGAYDVVFAFEAIHDLSDPVGVLRAMRALAKQGAPVIVMDERVADEFTAPGDDVERLMYGWSVLLCLPAGMADQPSAGTGTVMRASTLRRYAREAGFDDAETLDIEHPFFRFYRLQD